MILCAVQMHWDIRDYRSPQAFEEKIGSIMEQIRKTADWDEELLVAFPEYVGTPLAFMKSYEAVKDVKTLQDAVRILIKRNLFKILFIRLRYRVGWFRALALATAKDTARVYTDTFSRMAKSFRATIMAGSVLLPDFNWNPDIKKTDCRIPDRNIYNIAFLFGEEGNLSGIQKKAHLVPGLEDKGGFDLSEGKIDDLKVFDTPAGKVGIAVCLDCFKEPVVKALAEKGAKILIQPSANCKIWDKEEQQGWMEGCKKAMDTEKTFVYALNPMMTGCLFDLCFEGQSSIMTNVLSDFGEIGYKDLAPTVGFVKIASSPTQEEILMARKKTI